MTFAAWRAAFAAVIVFATLAVVLRRLWMSRQEVYVSPGYRDKLRTDTEGADALEDSLGVQVVKRKERVIGATSAPEAMSREWRAGR